MPNISKALASMVSIASAIAVGLSAAAAELAEVMPEGSETVVAWLIRIATWIGVAISIYATHTVVPKDLRGLAPPAGKQIVVTAVPGA